MIEMAAIKQRTSHSAASALAEYFRFVRGISEGQRPSEQAGPEVTWQGYLAQTCREHFCTAALDPSEPLPFPQFILARALFGLAHKGYKRDSPFLLPVKAQALGAQERTHALHAQAGFLSLFQVTRFIKKCREDPTTLIDQAAFLLD